MATKFKNLQKKVIFFIIVSNFQVIFIENRLQELEGILFF